MSELQRVRPVIEVGFMGAGKTTTGSLAAEKLGVPFYDTDEKVREMRGLTIPEIFASRGGEEAFRGLEVVALWRILKEMPGITSTGGGIVSTELGRYALSNCGAPVVWLRMDFDTAKRRVAEDPTPRPLFANIDKARGLFDMRQAWYEEVATEIIDASLPKEAVAAEIIRIAQVAA